METNARDESPSAANQNRHIRRYESKVGLVAQPLLAVRFSPIAVAMAKTHTGKSACATEAPTQTSTNNLDNSRAFHESPLIFNFPGTDPIDF
jgi:hypothetical protein